MTSNTMVGSPSEWKDYDCCDMAGHGAGSVLRVDATNVARPAEGYTFHQRPSDTWWVVLSVNDPMNQSVYMDVSMMFPNIEENSKMDGL